MKALDQLMVECLVEVWQSNRFRGTGFFVMPSKILTCAHVLDPDVGTIKIVYLGEEHQAALIERIPMEAGATDFYSFPDVALLHCESVQPHRLPILSDEIDTGASPLRSTGFVLGSILPRPGSLSSHPGLHSVLVDVAGISGSGVRVKGDVLPPGMSGSPVVDLGRRRVIGFLKAAGDPAETGGGWIIQLAQLRDVLPELFEDKSALRLQYASDWHLYAAERDRHQLALFQGADVPWAAGPTSRRPPSWFLVSSNRVVPYKTGPTYDELHAWAVDSGSEYLVTLLYAEGGAGKTRLAEELCETLTDEGWIAGICRTREEVERFSSGCLMALRAGNRVFLAVDYAETLVPQTAKLIDQLSRYASSSARVLLLARSAGSWWSSLKERTRAAILINPEVQVLNQLPAPLGEEFLRAYSAFAEACGTVVDKGPSAPAYLDELRVLDIHAAALDAVLGESGIGTASPLRAILDHERRYWVMACDSLANQAFAVSDPLVNRTLAIPTLLPATSKEDAQDGTSSMLSGYANLSRPDLIVNALLSIYPRPGGGWRALIPDRLAELLIADMLAGYSDIRYMTRDLAAIWKGQGVEDLHASVVVLVRILDQSDAIDERTAMVRAAIGVCVEHLDGAVAIRALIWSAAGAKTPRVVLDQILDSAEAMSLATLQAAIGSLPVNSEDSVPFVQFGVELMRHRLRLLRSETDQGVEEISDALTELAEGYRHLGQPLSGLPLIDEAIERLKSASPTSKRRHLLAICLNALGLNRVEEGKYEQAIPAFQEAVNIADRLAQIGYVAASKTLGDALANLSTYLTETGQRQLALAVARHTVEVRRKSVDEIVDDDSLQHASRLARLGRALESLSNRMSAVEMADEALSVALEAYNIQTSLAAKNVSIHGSDFASSAWQYGKCLVDAGQGESAEDCFREALSVRRMLYRMNPERHRYTLSLVLMSLGRVLKSRGDRDGLVLMQESVGHLAKLANEKPAGFAMDYAIELAELAGATSSFDNPLEGLRLISMAHGLAFSQFEGRPTPHMAMRYISILGRFANIAIEAGRAIDGRNISDMAAQLIERYWDSLVREHPSELGDKLAARRDLLETVGDFAVAEVVASRRVELIDAMRDSRLSRSSALSGALIDQAVVLARLNRQSDAAEVLRRAAREVENDDSVQAIIVRSRALANLGLLLVGLNRSAEAISPAKEAVLILRSLALGKDIEARLELAYALTNYGNALTETGQPRSALVASQEAVDILLALELDSRSHRLQLATALRNLAVDHQHNGRSGEAVDVGIQAVGILRELELSDTVLARQELNGVFGNLANAYMMLGRLEDAARARMVALRYANM